MNNSDADRFDIKYCRTQSNIMSPRNEFADIALGIFSLFGMHIIAIIIGSILAGIANSIHLYNLIGLLLYALFYIGLFQFFYVVPAIILLKRRQQWGLMKGVIIGAVLTVLLNGTCWLLVSPILSGMRR